ncbi:hypothetical protein [Lacticaseibacillus chiayiensis]|uniref:hypothetical protein n=1 Tax=Lacticaseibacillus chiayiensis TaxID=2100821 RepID=UPI001EDEABD2|nr:hypothetical protein [Lacticaseibacillus chiayiensis]
MSKSTRIDELVAVGVDTFAAVAGAFVAVVVVLAAGAEVLSLAGAAGALETCVEVAAGCLVAEAAVCLTVAVLTAATIDAVALPVTVVVLALAVTAAVLTAVVLTSVFSAAEFETCKPKYLSELTGAFLTTDT